MYASGLGKRSDSVKNILEMTYPGWLTVHKLRDALGYVEAMQNTQPDVQDLDRYERSPYPHTSSTDTSIFMPQRSKVMCSETNYIELLMISSDQNPH